jgi:hypothetical protein
MRPAMETYERYLAILKNNEHGHGTFSELTTFHRCRDKLTDTSDSEAGHAWEA